MKRLIIAAALMMSACATSYGDMGFAGGVRADQMAPDVYRIVSRGNGYTDSTTIADYAIRKAAETTLESGNEWFLVMGREDQSSVGQSSYTTPTMTTGTVSAYGNTASWNSMTTGGQTINSTFLKPGEDLMIKVGKGPKPEAAWDARQTLDYVIGRTGGQNSAGTVARRALLGG